MGRRCPWIAIAFDNKGLNLTHVTKDFYSVQKWKHVGWTVGSGCAELAYSTGRTTQLHDFSSSRLTQLHD